MRRSPQARLLESELRAALRTASDTGLITNSIGDVLAMVQSATQGLDEVIEVPRGGRNFERSPDAPHFRRDDGAWFDFAITLRSGEVIAWSFELRFPAEWTDGPRWVRFDLNPPDHANDERGLRCHVHLGSDDDGMSIAYPERAPGAVLHTVLHELRKTGRQRGVTPEPPLI